MEQKHIDLLTELLMVRIAQKAESLDSRSAYVAMTIHEKLKNLENKTVELNPDTAFLMGLMGGVLRLDLLSNEEFINEVIEGTAMGLAEAVRTVDEGALFNHIKEETLRTASPFNDLMA